MTVLSKGVAVADYELHRGGDGRIGVHWDEDMGGYYVPKNLTGWTCTLVLEDDSGGELYKTGCEVTALGDTWGNIPASVLSSDKLLHPPRGNWRLTGTNGSATELLGYGTYRIC